jgi:hypothetical protein
MDQENSDLQRQVDELVALVTAHRVDIDALTTRADASQDRADVAERRADDAQARADKMEARSVVDREMIAELQAEGVLSRDNVANLEAALVTSRTIGAAIGILMASRNIGQEEALSVLKQASQRSNVKMRDLAHTIVAGADAIK